MKKYGRCKFRKHKEIKGSDKIFTLNISAKFDSMNKMETTSSESEEKLERSGKWLVTALAFKTKVRSPKYKKARYAIRNISEKDLSKIIKEFEKIGKLPYDIKMPKRLGISAKFDSLKNMETTSSESKEKLERSGKWLVNARDFKTKVRSPK